MKYKVKHSKRVVGAPNSNKDRILGDSKANQTTPKNG